MKPSTRKIQKLVKDIEMANRLMYEEPCLKMEKEASAGQKKEINDTITKKLLVDIKSLGIKAVEAQVKINLDYSKLNKKHKKLLKIVSDAMIANFNKKRKTMKKNNSKKERVMSCIYSKDQGSYINHSE
jgi:hypothetical protein